ncbi:MAG: type III secretion system export apparatus subunit SctR [Deltaproteobacteria bacterium]|nr:type III secretion system export apparatus subunit SctR [Deltaproteobacteria bacterium]
MGEHANRTADARFARIATVACLLSFLFCSGAAAQAAQPSLNSGSLSTLAILATLALVPLLFLATTSFVKLSFVFSILRNALGAAQVPSAMVITVLAIILTCYVMAPVGQEMWKESARTLAEVDLDHPATAKSVAAIVKSVDSGKEPLRRFLKRNSAPQELKLFVSLAERSRPKDQPGRASSDDFLVVLSAFFFTELKEAFQIGFLVFIPFLVIDLVIANILLALGMQALSPALISIPFKLLLFVLVDGFYLLIQALVLGYR